MWNTVWVVLHGISITSSSSCVCVCVCVSLREESTMHATRARLRHRREIAVHLDVALSDLPLELRLQLLVRAVVLRAPSGPTHVTSSGVGVPFDVLEHHVRLVVGRAVRAVAVGIVTALARQ